MDNRRFDITGEGEHQLRLALQIAFGEHRTAIAYSSTLTKLVLFWSKHESASPLPVPLDHDGASDIVLRWLRGDDPEGARPDIDGDVGRGWRVWCEGWGHVDGMWQAFVAIERVWALYGK